MDENLTMTLTRVGIVIAVLILVAALSWFLLRRRRGDDDLDLHPRHRGSALDKGSPLPPGELEEFDAEGVELIDRGQVQTAQKNSRLNPSFFGGGKKAAQKAAAPEAAHDAPRMTLPLTIMARHGKSFNGADIDRLVRTFGLRRSRNHFFELIAGNGREVFFTLLNVHKPGTFPEDLSELQAIDGVMMVMRLPVGSDAVKSVETFLAMATDMTEAMNGRLCDYSRVPMSDKDLLNYRSAAEQFEEEYQAWRRRQR